MRKPVYGPQRRGISTFIAVLLLMVLTVAAGVVIYAYTMGYLGNLNIKPNGYGSLQIDSVAQYNGGLHIYVKNIGKGVAIIDSPLNGSARVYVNSINWENYEAIPNEIPEGVTCEIIVRGLDSSYVGKTTSVKIVTSEGVMIETEVKISKDVLTKGTPLVPAPMYFPASPVTMGNDVTLRASVSGSVGTPTGAVSFEVSTDDGSSWSTLVSGRQLDEGGKAEYTYKPGAGSYVYRVVYLGNSQYLGLTSGVSTVLIVNSVSTATKLIFSSNEGQFLTINVISGQVTVQRQDASGNPVTSDGTISVTLTATGSSTYAFYLDSYSTTQISSIEIPAGSANATFFFKDTIAGTPTIIGVSGSLTQAETTFSVSSYKLHFNKGDNQIIRAGDSSNEIIIQRLTWEGAPYTASADINIVLTTTSNGGKFYSDPGCTVEISSIIIRNQESTSDLLYYKDMNVGSPTLTASSTEYTPATIKFTITS